MPLSPEAPAWAAEIALAYESTAQGQFILSGNVHDRLPVGGALVNLGGFIEKELLGGFQVILITGFVMEGARIVATADPWGIWSPVGYAVGLALAPLGVPALTGLHLGLWWFHLILALAWIAYLPYSKLRHIAAAPANIYFRSFEPKGALSFIDIEKAFEQDPPPIGLSKLDDLTWKDRLLFEYAIGRWTPRARKIAIDGWGLTHDGRRLIASDDGAISISSSESARALTARSIARGTRASIAKWR